jgi:hypothetical protein
MKISPMHEYHFSLKGKYKNTHFALIEEQDILTNITLYLATYSHLHMERRHFSPREKMREMREWDVWNVSLF